MMNGSSVANTSPSVKSKEDQGLDGHDEKENPFAEYMWMENEEDFNRQVEEELQEQDFLDRCFQEMLDEEDQDWFIPSRDLPQAMGQLQQQLNGLSVGDGHDSEDILGSEHLENYLSSLLSCTARGTSGSSRRYKPEYTAQLPRPLGFPAMTWDYQWPNYAEQLKISPGE